MPHPFQFYRTPGIRFGDGAFDDVPGLAARFGSRALVITGGSSFRDSGNLTRLIDGLSRLNVTAEIANAPGEPSPKLVDSTVAAFRHGGIEVVIAAGGGSSIDAGKAIAAMLPLRDSVMEYIEGIGGKKHPGTKTPFIAVPTTSGTGSEATKNAVLSRVGPGGFKKSLRHDTFTPDVAVVDPSLALSCPVEVTAACGMDALTQLIESYVSSKATPFTDSLGLFATDQVLKAIRSACSTGAGDIAVRSAMAYGSLVSGITLANAGLGIVHGLASPLGARFQIPHGSACGTLLAAAVRITIKKLRERGNLQALKKYGQLGSLVDTNLAPEAPRACDALVTELYRLTEDLRMPRLSSFGMSENDVETIAAQASNKNNPEPLEDADIRNILAERL
ncbi:MAG: iron-containing alcohol dehydrogenase [Chitinivibrionales bacterium]|nr:iron-containing alcohol dehydrogenase [Chitinivibrionales bacterium]MBD3396078.1 iron-containing alcohol dehydrogenase [Chitinivibrionales bacterium]